MQKKRTIEITITSFSKDGSGIAHVQDQNGKAFSVEVPFTMPGDKVRATLIKKRKGAYQALLEEIIEPSPNRITPRCIHFAKCGGCRWQQIDYENQLAIKEKFIDDCFAPFLNPPQLTRYPIIPCHPPWQYRNKMEFSFSSDLAKNHYLGLVMYGSKGKVFQMSECHLVNPWFVDCIKAVQHWWDASDLDAYHLGKNSGSLRTLTVREGIRSGDRLVMLTVSGNPEFALHKNQIDAFIRAVRDAVEPADERHKLSIFLRIQQIAKGSPTQFYELHLYGPDHIREILHIKDKVHVNVLTFKVSPSAFFQPNTRQAEVIYSKALELVEPELPEGSLVYDLYCGTGTLGICAARRAREVIGIEISPESVLDARENIKNNGLQNVNIIQGDVGKVLAEIVKNGKSPDLIMVDPPRSGLDPRAIKTLVEIKAPQILYISCNPISQSANIKDLIAGGYELRAIQPVDHFPQTVHVENIVLLRRKI